MKKIIKPSIIIITILLSIILSLSSFQLPKTMPEDASEDVFSSSRAMIYDENIAKFPHPIESSEDATVRDYIVQQFIKLGLKPSIQKAQSQTYIWGNYVSGYVENIYAILHGSDKSGHAILMSAHYDSSSRGPGAADDAMSVSTLLETLRTLKAGHPLKNDVIFLITDGEEAGLLGANAFVKESTLLKKVYMAMNFEARGNSGPVIMFQTGDKNGWFMKEFKKATPYPVAYSFANDIYKHMPNETDFTFFKNAGINGFNFAPIVGYDTYHNSTDTPESLNQRTLQHDGTYALNLIRHFGNLSLTERNSTNAVYFTIMKSVLVLYSSFWTIPLSIFILILFIIAIILGFKKNFFTPRGILLGLLTFLVSAVITFGIGTIGEKIFNKMCNNILNPDQYSTYIKYSNVLIIVLIFLSLLIMSLLYNILGNKLTKQDMLIGSLLIWVLLAIVSGILLKGASYMFLWPALMTLIGIIAGLAIKSEFVSKYKHLILIVLSAPTCILIYLPISFLLFESMTIKAAGILTGIISLPLAIIILSIYLALEKPIEIDTNENISTEA